MLEHFWLPCLATVAVIALSAILFKAFLKPVEGSADHDSSTETGSVERAARSCTSSQVNETATSSGHDYEVFLSFRGPDIRDTFADYLYTSLDGAGIRTFRDNEELRVGEAFAPKLLQAIEHSKIFIPIFSKGYASSKWCLNELVQMVQMVEGKKSRGQKIMPIFYDVPPSELRHPTGVYDEAFRLHKKKKRHGERIMKEWKEALLFVGKISGWDWQSMPERGEGAFAKQITEEVFNELKKAHLALSDCWVNVDNHVGAIMKMMDDKPGETRVIGIHGMSGIGKTTIAKMIYQKLSHDFENRCFLLDIRETSTRQGIAWLQDRLVKDILKTDRITVKDTDVGTQTIKARLSGKRVLLLLDDVETEDHINAFLCERDWLGRGSKIIVTTKIKGMLYIPKVDHSYELDGMNPDQSLQLFSKHAFRRDSPLEEYVELSNEAIEIAGGLPLALEVMGSLLGRTKKKDWHEKLEEWKAFPPTEVEGKLKGSYEVLKPGEKHMFLDIACLFIGYDIEIMAYFWGCIRESNIAMNVLENMSLIKIKEDNKVWMHDQVRNFGRQIVRQESCMRIEKQSRVWDPDHALNLLRTTKVKKDAEALRLQLEYERQLDYEPLDYERRFPFTYEDFENLSRLRFLEMQLWSNDFHSKEERLFWHESQSNVVITNENSCLLPCLRWLSWNHIPPTFNIASFSMENVVILDLSCSYITDDWKGWSHMKVIKNLKVLDLSYCDCLKKTPIFSTHSKLERLILCGCSHLVEVHGSICHLKCLVSLDLSDCWELQRLPDELGANLGRLKYFSLKGCYSLEKLPDPIENLEQLIQLDISGTSFKKLPDSIGKWQNLEVVKMGYNRLEKIPATFWTIEKLGEIDFENHNSPRLDVKIGDCIYKNQSLRILKLRYVHMYGLPRLPESLITLDLKYLYMDTFPDLSNLTNLKELDLCFRCRDSGGPVTTSPTDLSLLSQLKSLHLRCSNLRHLPMFPSSLSSLHLEECRSLCFMGDVSNLKNLSSLEIKYGEVAEIQGLGCLENLRDLKLFYLEKLERLPDLRNLSKLGSLCVLNCDSLVEIQGELPRFLNVFSISECSSLQKLPDLSTLTDKTRVRIHLCPKINVEAILVSAQEDPRRLSFYKFEQLQIIPDLSNLRDSNKITCLDVANCDNLVEIQGDLPPSLEKLVIRECESLQKMPDMSSLRGLQTIIIENCRKLNGEAIFGFAQRKPVNVWENLEWLHIAGIGKVTILPDLSNSNKLRTLRVERCGDLVEIQGDMPQSLRFLVISSCTSLQKLPDLSSLKELRRVVIEDCKKLNGEAIFGFAQRRATNVYENLQYLQLSDSGQMEILSDLSNLNKLTYLGVIRCGDLVEIQGDMPQSLEAVVICECESLRELPDMSSLKGLQMVIIKDCRKLNGEAIFGFTQGRATNVWENLRYLRLSDIGRVKILPDLSNSSKLLGLEVIRCGDLVEIQGDVPQSLVLLVISSCESLQKLPDLSSLKKLEEVVIVIEDCKKLNGEIFRLAERRSAMITIRSALLRYWRDDDTT